MQKIYPLVLIIIILLISGIFIELPIWLSASILSILFVIGLYVKLAFLNHKTKGKLVLRTNGERINVTFYIVAFLLLGYFIYKLYINDVSGSSLIFLVVPINFLVLFISHIVRKTYKPIVFVIDGNTLIYYDFSVKEYDIEKFRGLMFDPERKRLQLDFDGQSSILVDCTSYDSKELLAFFETVTEKSERNFKFLKRKGKGFTEALKSQENSTNSKQKEI
ncbi:hypothetical protein EZY14_010325 [Kordia sp. TARA_039_SRF]|nr:hypothetical protein EZY14_010325 [Kordia sp. TARA_039_SRF]